MTNAEETSAEPHVIANAPLPLEDPLPAPYSRWARRVVAALLDSAIATGTTFLAFGDPSVEVPFMGPTLLRTTASGLPATSWTDSGWVVAAVLLVVAMQAYLGATPGKMVVGIAVVRERDARPIGFVRTTLRWFAHLIDAILFIGYLRPLWNERRQTFADSITSTVVIETRRPRRHLWRTSESRSPSSPLDPGPPQSWEAPVAPRWWPAVTAICAVSCTVGVLLSFDFGPGQGSGPFTVSCTMTAPDQGALGLTGGTLSSSSQTVSATRLGITRPVRGSHNQVLASWQWSSTPPTNRAVTLRTSFVPAGSAVATHYDHPLTDRTAHKATISLPAAALTELGDTWTWTQTVLVDGLESPGCSGQSPG